MGRMKKNLLKVTHFPLSLPSSDWSTAASSPVMIGNSCFAAELTVPELLTEIP